jgi:hypothetical protein
MLVILLTRNYYLKLERFTSLVESRTVYYRLDDIFPGGE